MKEGRKRGETKRAERRTVVSWLAGTVAVVGAVGKRYPLFTR